jgi:hypothetical protein
MRKRRQNRWAILVEDVGIMIRDAQDEDRKKELELSLGVFRRMAESDESWPRRRRKTLERHAPNGAANTSDNTRGLRCMRLFYEKEVKRKHYS